SVKDCWTLRFFVARTAKPVEVGRFVTSTRSFPSCVRPPAAPSYATSGIPKLPLSLVDRRTTASCTRTAWTTVVVRPAVATYWVFPFGLRTPSGEKGGVGPAAIARLAATHAVRPAIERTVSGRVRIE